jgi:site-specific DNA-cytosine methylase
MGELHHFWMLENVDTTKTITHLGLCAGYGGIELGLKRVLPTLRSVALCEIEAFACANLVAKMEAGLMDAAPIWTDLKTFPWAEFSGKVDILSGGYPCQPFSAAGKRLGTEDERHLWPYIASGIRILTPRVCFFENVEGHISLGLREVVAELESIGYETTFGIFSAAECGASHQRKRVFILAYSADERQKWSSITRSCSASGAVEGCGNRLWPSRPGEPQYAWEPPRVVANSIRGRGKESEHIDTDLLTESSRSNAQDVGNFESHTGNRLSVGKESQQSQFGFDGKTICKNNSECKTQPTLGRDSDGPACGVDYAELSVTCDNCTDELRLLGNGVVPATAELAFRTLMQQL